MSAIWGAINIKQNHVDKELISKMHESFSWCKIDKSTHIIENNIILGCEHQFITYESEMETLPFIDRDKGIYMTADVILDDREALMKLLEINDKYITDGQLLYNAFLKWGQDFPKYLLGDFSFVIYDSKKNEILCGRDAIGKRSIYFSYKDGVLYFSTLINSLVNARNIKGSLNRRWINDFLAISGLAHVSECTETIYNEIYQIEPGQTLLINKDGINKKYYWNPIKDVKKLKLNNDKDYEQEFINIFNKCVHSKIRTNGNVGLMLSGGLDSNAVAVLASKHLNNNILRTYTSVPLDEYESNRSRYYVINESSRVKKLSKYIKNIEPTFCDCKDTDSYSNLDYFIDIFEGPYKVIQNTFWMNEILKKAANDNCKIMLNGQYGNATISYGNIIDNSKDLLLKGQFVSLYKQINSYCKKNKLSRKIISKYVFTESVPYRMKVLFSRNNDKFENTLVNTKILKEMNTKKRFNKLDIKLTNYKECIFNRVPLSQIGEIETKFSLRHGLVIRDPSRDKRMIEFCLSLPQNQFVYNGVSRRLIREYMKDFLPDYVLIDNHRRGLQSADWAYRLNKRWNDIYKDIKQKVNNPKLIEYIDQAKVTKAIEELKEGLTNSNENLARNLISVSILSIYIDKNI